MEVMALWRSRTGEVGEGGGGVHLGHNVANDEVAVLGDPEQRRPAEQMVTVVLHDVVLGQT
jgi:hypothetical protein